MAKKEDNAQKKEKKQRRGVHFSNSREAKLKLIPPFVMLAAGAVTSIIMVVHGCGLHQFLTRLLLVLFLFYVLGCVLKGTLDMIERQNRPPEPDESEDEVIEKGSEEEKSEEEASEEGDSEEETSKE